MLAIFFCSTYENITLIGDFIMKLKNEKLNDFCEMNKFKHLKPTCFKGLFPSTIDLILTNHKQSFIKLDLYEPGISDHHKMIFSILRKTFAKEGKPKTVVIATIKSLIKTLSTKHFKTRFHNLQKQSSRGVL